MRRARPTLAAVARHAGVSVTTVSKVLNSRTDVAAGTRERVAASMRAVGYVPTTAKRLFAEGASLAVVFDGITNAYSAQVLESVRTAAYERGAELSVDIMQAVPDGRPVPWTEEWVRRCLARGTVGALAVATEVSDAAVALCEDIGLPVVLVDPPHRPGRRTVSIGSTNYAGALEAVEHLVASGHRRVAFLGGTRGDDATLERLAGCRSALDVHGLPEPTVVLDASTVDRATEAALVLLSAEPRPTAVMCANDVIALRVLEAARRLGIPVPAELSVVGFDDTYLAEWAVPPLTSVHQPIREMGMLAATTLLDLAEGRRPPARRLQLATTLVVRSTTAAAPEAAVGGAA
ncbi:LacI family DNA-binding transcriptional regulator [Demequina sp. SYSU T00039]|uniref:LacI family DNA-binding transcriptional regulator n=1 Tax=Demequina lignilytica TaxID=3051663 RepID=A0AAW7M0X3_9MICO|nr:MULTISPECIES: LacI family DNA-binding transcriptional regulator [unclassified Demequina]MDN4477596.1 LacI family DNA-binding transcriptional regulator [Demequina sp. SYSU T00039-1]MDN4488053.1 LacI family DNA-binding transcriptional regulator [Demequina sp. SYSU T00039]